MKTHTPGPWLVSGGPDTKRYVVASPIGTDTELNEPIALVPCDDVTIDGLSEAQRNLALIVAAPRLLDVLEQITILHSSGAVDESWWNEARKAVSMARRGRPWMARST